MHEAWFDIGHHVSAKVMADCIILAADSPKEQGLIEELWEVKKAQAQIRAKLSAVQLV